MPVVYLISGANRGIGLGLVEAIAAKPDCIVFAGARDPSSAIALQALAAKHPARVYVVKLTSADAIENAAAVTRIEEVAGRLDVVIANAGISSSYDGPLTVPLDVMHRHWEVNTAGPLVLYQHTLPLIRASPRPSSDSRPPPKFVLISSVAGSIALASRHSTAPAYGASKAAANFLTRVIHDSAEAEEIGLVAFPICPGPVGTDMLNAAKANIPLIAEMQAQTVEETVARLVDIIDAATREETGGRFMQLNGMHPW